MNRVQVAGMALAAALAAQAHAAQPPTRLPPNSCVGAERTKPTLNPRLLPGATFRIVEEVVEEGRAPALNGVESAILKDGVRLTVSLMGCHAYSNQYAFSLPPDPRPFTDRAYWLKRAAGLIREIAPASTDIIVSLDRMARLLTDEARDRQSGYRADANSAYLLEDISNGNAFGVIYTVEIKRTAMGVTLKVSHTTGIQ